MNIKTTTIEILSKQTKKDLLMYLKNTSNYYKDHLLGYRFLIVYDEGKYVEILFRKRNFKHLTGISTHYDAEIFFDLCVGKRHYGKISLLEEDLFTTKSHSFSLVSRKMKIFDKIHQLFYEPSYILENVKTNTRIYHFGFTKYKLTLLCAYYGCDSFLTPTILREKLDPSKYELCHEIKAVFIKRNPYFKYKTLTYCTKYTVGYLIKYKEKLCEVIDYDSM